MKIYLIKASIEREVEAEDKIMAIEKFLIELEEDNALENTTTENRLIDNIEVKEIGR